MMNDDGVFRNVSIILRGKGDFEPNSNPMYLQRIYRDAKLEITAYIKMGSDEMEAIYVDLHLPNNNASNQATDKPFSISSRNKEGGLEVYYWEEGHLRYFRPGRWITYIANLAKELTKQGRELSLLNGHDIDDSSLFPNE